MSRTDQENVAVAESLMASFAVQTGLDGDARNQRYLWTDAFAVTNYLALARRPGKAHYLESALRLVDRVHYTLGRHRNDDARSGWISGLAEAEALESPTRGGLRIGKPLPERAPDETFDERLEWERDGQYFHYLTKWMRALDLAAQAAGDPHLNVWARDLADVTHRRFCHGAGHARHVYWKMSIDLSRPLVSSMGHHDPLDGFLTCLELRRTANELGSQAGPDLERATSEYSAMIARRDLATADPLGIGGLLVDSARVAQLAASGLLDGEPLLTALLSAAGRGVSAMAEHGDLRRPAEERLAFRELGLCIGLASVGLVGDAIAAGRLRFPGCGKFGDATEELSPYLELGSTLQNFWLDPRHRSGGGWRAHQQINDVMLASSLIPDGGLAPLETT